MLKRHSLFKGIDKIIECIASLCLFLMVFLVFLNVVLRYFFASGISEGEELARFLFVWSIFLGAILAYREDKHVKVDILISKLRDFSRRFIYVLGYLIIIIVCGILIWGGWKYVFLSTTIVAPATEVPFTVISVPFLITFIVLFVLAIAKLGLLIIRRHGGRDI